MEVLHHACWNGIDLQTQTIISDFEKASMTAVKAYFLDANFKPHSRC